MKNDSTSLKSHLHDGLIQAQNALNLFLQDENSLDVMNQMAVELASTFKNQGKVLSCGNGGSACDALHFAEEFTGRFRKDRPALPVIPLMESSHVTCVANDYGWEEVFARGVSAYGQKDDILLAISTSGNSKNILRAVEQAQAQRMKIFLFLGKNGGQLAGKGHYQFIVPGETTDRIQELHMLILHLIIEGVERILFPQNYQ